MGEPEGWDHGDWDHRRWEHGGWEEETGRKKLGGVSWEEAERRKLGGGSWEEEASPGGNPGGSLARGGHG